QLPLHRPLRQGRRRRRALERRRPGGGLARGRAAAVGQGRQRAVPGADPGRAAAGVPGMRLLVVGANGQVGRELRRSLAELGQVLPATRDGRLDDGTACAVADLGDPDGLARLVRDTTPDAVVNAAAYTAVDKAEDEPDVAWRINAQAPGVLARAGAGAGIPLVHYSTDYVFDGRGTRPYREDDPTAPLGAYGASKRAGEEAVLAAGGRPLVFRTAWVYAAHGHNF